MRPSTPPPPSRPLLSRRLHPGRSLDIYEYVLPAFLKPRAGRPNISPVAVSVPSIIQRRERVHRYNRREGKFFGRREEKSGKADEPLSACVGRRVRGWNADPISGPLVDERFERSSPATDSNGYRSVSRLLAVASVPLWYRLGMLAIRIGEKLPKNFSDWCFPTGSRI